MTTPQGLEQRRQALAHVGSLFGCWGEVGGMSMRYKLTLIRVRFWPAGEKASRALLTLRVPWITKDGPRV